MSGFYRKLRRNKIKKQVGNNRISETWHQINSTIDEIMREGMKKNKENRK